MENNYISMRASDSSIVKIEYHERVESSIGLMREYAQDKTFPDRYAVLSRYDYTYGSDSFGLHMSLLLRPSLFPSQVGLLTALATVALVKALEEHTEKPLGIGWVGKVYCDGKQIGGVSIEGKLDNYTTYEYIIVNFSVKLSNENFPPRLTDLIKKVFEEDNNSIAMIIAKNILNKFFPYYQKMKSSSKFMLDYQQKFILSGVKVKLIEGGKKTSCKVLSVSREDCSLIVEARDKSIRHITRPASVIIPKAVKITKK